MNTIAAAQTKAYPKNVPARSYHHVHIISLTQFNVPPPTYGRKILKKICPLVGKVEVLNHCVGKMLKWVMADLQNLVSMENRKKDFNINLNFS